MLENQNITDPVWGMEVKEQERKTIHSLVSQLGDSLGYSKEQADTIGLVLFGPKPSGQTAEVKNSAHDIESLLHEYINLAERLVKQLSYIQELLQ